MEAIHVELSDKGAKVGVLEEAREELPADSVRREDDERVASVGPVDEVTRRRIIDHSVGQLFARQRASSLAEGSCTTHV